MQNGFIYTLAGGSGSVSYMFKNNKFQTNVMGSYQANLNKGVVNGGVLNGSVGVNISLNKKHQVATRCTYLNSTNKKIAQQNYREVIGQIDYRFSF
jgi:hypothetical protein